MGWGGVQKSYTRTDPLSVYKFYRKGGGFKNRSLGINPKLSIHDYFLLTMTLFKIEKLKVADSLKIASEIVLTLVCTGLYQ